ncbi:hypothetical protein FRB94_005503 [Tulasnella sp. JGI-2019a]|nr:hypothetical protein FRB93_005987 [Tulasnella sp. JGI-2019a]KAG9012568.1 hypothetical protein FRB94_005503 [Tulasnella sp. JGI-2019a]KAG9038258.1 hypothetical protein FRB95_002219 [Tulasnella sp. JGI-2019a]
MSLPPINPKKSTAGISVDPKTLDRVVAATKRADGTVRKELKIRPGFTPQEDVGMFRGSRQAALEARKTGGPGGGRIIPGWAPPEEVKPKPPKSKGMSPNPLGGGASKGQQKKKDDTKSGKGKKADPEPVKDSWEEDDEMADTSDVVEVKSDGEAKPLANKPEADSVNVGPTGDDLEALSKQLADTQV